MKSGLRQATLGCIFASIFALACNAHAQANAYERLFPQSKAQIDEALKNLQANLAGRLPVLEGFASPGQYPLDHYERGYFQAKVQVFPAPTGGSLVRVSVKVTAWYKDPEAYRSGYQLLTSNGRLEADVLDQLTDQLASAPPNSGASDAASYAASLNPAPSPQSSETAHTERSSSESASSESASSEPAVSGRATAPATSAPTSSEPTGSERGGSEPSSSESASKEPSAPAPRFPDTNLTFAESVSHGLAEQGLAKQRLAENGAAAPGNASTGSAVSPTIPKTPSAVQAETASLEEVLKSQVHPKNLVAVKKSGTPVVDAASLSAKTLFLASMHDEFELLNFNADWVHVRISGLSRGWIWRNSVEMPEGIPDTEATSAKSQVTAADLFHVTREETATFPGDWEPLRGKNVKIVTVQETDENTKGEGPRQRLEYVKFLLEKNYAELSQKSASLAGIVIIFDSADGGMIGATLSALQQWRAGTLSDSALWHKSFFDPPETFDSSGTSASPGSSASQ
jgi:hypothetical protein